MSHRADGLNDIFENDVTIKKKIIAQQGGTIQDAPVGAKDIVNKEYVDNNKYTDAEAVAAVEAAGYFKDQTDVDHNSITNTHNLTTDIDHDQLTNFAANEHFTEASIDHTNIQSIGTNTHAQIDTHIASGAIHFSDLSGFDTDDLTEGATNKYDQTVTLNEGANITITGTYPTFTIAASGGGGSGTMTTVKANGSQVGDADIVTLDFGNQFTISESPDTEINISLNYSNIDHDSLSGFVSNEHIDWTSTSSNISTSGTIAGGTITVTDDQNTNDTEYVPMVLHGTDATPPTASNFPMGTIYIQYTA